MLRIYVCTPPWISDGWGRRFGFSALQEWTPAFENYRLLKINETRSTFVLEQDIPEEYVAEFTKSWERGFDRIALFLETPNELGKVITLRERSSHSPEFLWKKLVTPELVMTWNFASDDWHCPNATNELTIGGEFHYALVGKTF